MKISKEEAVLNQIIHDHIKPFIKKIDEEAYYPKDFLRAVGNAGFFKSKDLIKEYVNCKEINLIEEVAKHCMTSAFILWCHLAALATVKLSNNPFIKYELLPLLESGDVIGATGLSNALKYYGGLESIRLKAERTDGGYILTGSLPSVSNLDHDHWFVILASLNQQQRVLCVIPVKIKGLVLESKINYVGLNGSATYSCSFQNVFVPDKLIITEAPDEIIPIVRQTFVLYQIPLGIGVSKASISSIVKRHSKNYEANKHLKPQPKELIDELQYISKKTYEHTKSSQTNLISKDILLTRLEIAKLALKVTNAEMLYSGGQAFLQGNDSFRRLREAFFLANLSPTIRQLETLG